MATYKNIRYNTPIGGGGSAVLLAETTASSDSTISFTSGIDSTYKEYLITFINVHPATDEKALTFNGSTDTGSNYNLTKTTTFFQASHTEGDSTSLAYDTNRDLAQGTGFQQLSTDVGNGNDESVSGYLSLFNPSDTTFVKHFIASTNGYYSGDATANAFVTGYFNTTSDVDAIQFKFVSGNIDAGTFKLYGIN